MAGEWPELPVSSAAEVVIGGTASRNVPDYWNDTIPRATPRDVAVGLRTAEGLSRPLSASQSCDDKIPGLRG